MLTDKEKHDFINNCIRIEILQKIINEDISQNKEIDSQYKKDLKRFYEEQINLVKKL